MNSTKIRGKIVFCNKNKNFSSFLLYGKKHLYQEKNVHAGFICANSLLVTSRSDTQKIIILLSNADSTFYIDTINNICGNGHSDSSDCNVFGNIKPSAVANVEAIAMKTSGIIIYTIGFNMPTKYTFLGNIAISSSNIYLASDYEATAENKNNINMNMATVAFIYKLSFNFLCQVIYKYYTKTIVTLKI